MGMGRIKMLFAIIGIIGMSFSLYSNRLEAQDDLVSFLNQLEKSCDILEQQRDQIKPQNLEEIRSIVNLPGIPGYAKKSAEVAVRQGEDLPKALNVVIERARTLISEARSERDMDRKKKLIKEDISNAINAGNSLVRANNFIMPSLEYLETFAKNTIDAASQPNLEMSEEALDRVWSRKDMGGGVFLNETAEIPIDRGKITHAEYDLKTRRFILHESNQKWFLPKMDPDKVAVVIKCLYDEQKKREISMSFNIDPVTMGRIDPGVQEYEKVLFGCSYLPDTEVGRILIDADDLNTSLWWGMNREGKLLITTFDYHSLIQLTLDHPVTSDVIKKTPFLDRWIDMRIWIKPNEIRLHQSSGFFSFFSSENKLEFDDISFRMYSETVKLRDRSIFKGTAFPNPGADVFTAYFNRNFEKFVNVPLRKDITTRRVIRPLQELKEVARIVGVVRWIKGERPKQKKIDMDTSWVRTYQVREVETKRNLRIPDLSEIQKETKGPIVIYNQYGPSRIIDEARKIWKVKYNKNGRPIEMIQMISKNGQDVEVRSTILKISR